MARRDYRQKSFADVLVRGRQRKRKRLERLADMLELIDWKPVEGTTASVHNSQVFAPLISGDEEAAGACPREAKGSPESRREADVFTTRPTG